MTGVGFGFNLNIKTLPLIPTKVGIHHQNFQPNDKSGDGPRSARAAPFNGVSGGYS